MRWRFDGTITGIGTTGGTRLVIGRWARSPFGPFTDVMVETADAHRTLLAPTQPVADFVAATYRFDDVRVEAVSATDTDTGFEIGSQWLQVQVLVGRRTAVGRLLSLVPAPVATSRWWSRAIGPAARLIRPGVRTVGSAGHGRTEYYCARDEHAVTAATAVLDGVDCGGLAPVDPPVGFGFASSPSTPSAVSITTLIDER